MSNNSAPVTATPSRLRKIAGVAALSFAVVVVSVYMLGPRNHLGPNTPTPRPLPPEKISQLEDWIKSSEAAYSDIKPGNAKGIVWNSKEKKKTPWSVVYLHGFSASRLETAPLTDKVAQALGANAFHTRLTGHGRTNQAMGEATAQDWMADTVEAIRIGQTLGDKVLVISCSTGGTLSTWFATSPEANKVAAHVLLSPNYGPKDKKSEIINTPWGKQLATLIMGPTRSWKPENELVAGAWTFSYPSQAVFPVMALVKSARESDLSTFKAPVMIIYSEKDMTVDPAETKAVFERIGSPIKTLQAVTYAENDGQHLLAGDIRSPGSTDIAVKDIVKWVQTLP